jgi:hypothetical protein
MEEHRAVLRRVGAVLVVVGLADIGLMVYCVMTKQNYSSSLNIFAVIAGALLLRGHLGTARFVTSASAFFIGALLSAFVVLLPFTQPADLWLAQFRIHPLQMLGSFAFAAAATGLMVWTYRQLRSPPVLAARSRAGHSTAIPKLAFAVGGSIPVLVAVMLSLFLTEEMRSKAVLLAQDRLGDTYKYHVTAFRSSGSHTNATVTAWNATEIKTVEVEW